MVQVTTLELQRAYLKIQVLKQQLRLERIRKYGRASEKLSDAQLALLELEPSLGSAEGESLRSAESLRGVRFPA